MLSPTGPSLASARHLFSEARELAARGHRVTVLVPHHYHIPFEETGAPDTEILDGVTVKHVFLPPRWRGNIRTHFFPLGYWTWKLVRRAMETPFDIVHVMKPYYTSGPAGLLLSLIAGKPMVLECDDLEGWTGWAGAIAGEPLFGFKLNLIDAYERRLPPLADAVIADTRALEEMLLARGVGRERLFYIPYCVEDYMTRLGEGTRIRWEYGFRDAPVIIYCGALHPHHYDCDLLIPAMEAVRMRIPGARMLVVGDGGARPELENKARKAGLLGTAVLFAGWIPAEAIPDYIAAADIAVVPMRDTPASRSRGLSKVLEYLCQGKPVVMPGIGQAGELTDGGKAGILVRAGDALAMADGIVELLANPGRARAMGGHGRDYALATFDRAESTDKILGIYASLLHTGTPARASAGKESSGVSRGGGCLPRHPSSGKGATARRLPGTPFLNVRMDVTNICNLKCRMCYFSLPGHTTIDGAPPKHMPLPLLEKIARQVFPHARFIALSCGAESLMYPHFDRYLKLVADAHVEWTELITNAQLLNQEYARMLIEARLSMLTVSMDGATRSTYEAIRCGARFDRLMENILVLNELKKAHNSDRPLLHIQYVLMRSNIEELPRAVVLAKEVGAQSFNCLHMAPIGGLHIRGDSLYFHKQLANTMLDEARDAAKKVGLAATFPGNFGASPGGEKRAAPPARCIYDPWHHLFITESGIAYPCGWLTKQTATGSFETQDFEEIWWGEEYERLRREIATGHYRTGCLKCPTCAGGDVDEENAFLER